MAGQMVHVEFPAGDTAKAVSSGARSSAGTSSRIPGPSEYLMTRFSDNQGGAIYGAEGDERGPRVYFDVDDINTGIARVKELGGEAGEGMPVPSMGWFATCTDTEGNEFGLWQTDPNAPNRARSESQCGRGAATFPARSARPASAPVCRPSSTTTTPFTST